MPTLIAIDVVHSKAATPKDIMVLGAGATVIGGLQVASSRLRKRRETVLDTIKETYDEITRPSYPG